jgi:hypothetical protein
MQNIKQIMCVIDPTAASHPALQRAAWLAEKSSAELELFVCYYNEYLSDLEKKRTSPPNQEIGASRRFGWIPTQDANLLPP